MILFIENPKDSIKKLLELIDKLLKLEDKKINLQKSVAFDTTSTKLQKEKSRIQSHLQLHQQE